MPKGKVTGARFEYSLWFRMQWGGVHTKASNSCHGRNDGSEVAATPRPVLKVRDTLKFPFVLSMAMRRRHRAIPGRLHCRNRNRNPNRDRGAMPLRFRFRWRFRFRIDPNNMNAIALRASGLNSVPWSGNDRMTFYEDYIFIQRRYALHP